MEFISLSLLYIIQPICVQFLKILPEETRTIAVCDFSIQAGDTPEDVYPLHGCLTKIRQGNWGDHSLLGISSLFNLEIA